jgi:DNA-binding response OmpR family regulator
MRPERDPLATVVVCEADDTTLTLICDRLTAERFEVLPARSAVDALRLCRYGHPDVVLVDLALSGDCAPELVRRIREADPRLPIILLASRGNPRSRQLRGDLGADDMLAKPFRHEELRARLDSVLRRRHHRGDAPVQVGALLIDPRSRRVTVDGREVHLTKKEFLLLRVLAADPDAVFSKQELLREVWGPRLRAGQTRTLESHASRLRRKLDPEDGRYVVNCWGVGYSLLARGGSADGGPR